jgi:hypothetical protein
MKFTTLVLALALPFGAYAAEEQKSEAGKSSVKIEDAANKKNKVDGNIDEEITNAKLRAESGSKSKFSLSSSMAYTGGSISRPFGKDRPNIVGTVGEQTRTSGDLGLDARYRWSKASSVTVGTSFGIMTPLHGDTDKNESQLNMFDPNVAYNIVGKFGEIQTNAAVAYYHGTSQESDLIDRDGRLYATITPLRVFQNGLTLGLAADATYYMYGSKPGQNAEGASSSYGGDARTSWDVALYPFMEYAINDKFSARTVFGYFNWRHVYGDDNKYRLLQKYVYQSIGIGYSVSRDVYLYPNVQFAPDNVRSDFTNVAISATVNMF